MNTNVACPPIRPNPGDTPFYAPGLARKTGQIVTTFFCVNYKLYHRDIAMNMALIKMMYEFLESNYAADLQDTMLNFKKSTFFGVFAQVVLKWAWITPSQRVTNCNSMVKPLSPNDGATMLWHHLQICANFWQYCRETIPNTHIRDAALFVLHWSQAYNQVYLDVCYAQDRSLTELKSWHKN